MFSLAETDTLKDPIIPTQAVIERSAVIRYLLAIIRSLETKSFGDVDTCRYEIGLVDKWDMPDI
jgi:hypothetical protein